MHRPSGDVLPAPARDGLGPHIKIAHRIDSFLRATLRNSLRAAPAGTGDLPFRLERSAESGQGRRGLKERDAR
ncbi:hypothetical protein GCM10009727_15880 [Actinomadura napierensis]|uniref:Uncharacterized protein n=1 Tax=Actinomadura napierensis TaxID=267854 RepID=A0ABP5K6Q1_9ACTN